jgi:transitional endoplasmic reticulum ATPase
MRPQQLCFDDKYYAQFLLTSSCVIDTYRVKNDDKKNYFLKLYKLPRLLSKDFTKDGEIREIEILKKLEHPNVISYHDSGEAVVNGLQCAYLVTEYISGESLSDHLRRKLRIDSTDAISCAIQVLEGLSYLHSLEDPIVHNSINLEHLIIDGGTHPPKITVAGFRFARDLSQSSHTIDFDSLNPYYLPDEGFNKVFSKQSDIFSVGAAIYNLCYGIPPWFVDMSQHAMKNSRDAIIKARSKPLKTVSTILDDVNISESLLQIMMKALNRNLGERYANAEDFLAVLRKESQDFLRFNSIKMSYLEDESKIAESSKDGIRGFEAIAGMEELKDILNNDVINIFKDPEGAQSYGLTIPNGMLLFGPPGCGKTFIAEKLAEEVEFNYYFVKASDLASPYIFDTQRKTGELFSEAYKNSPSVICFDEFDSYAFKKEQTDNASMVGVVNELLSQLNNCGKKGVFVIATTNYPERIEQSILRRGRMDLVIYVSPPDESARKGLFEIYLKNKPIDFSIEYAELAEKTIGYVASDIEFIVQNAAREAYRDKKRITQELLLKMIAKTSPSVSDDDFKKYEYLRKQYDRSEHRGSKDVMKVGFRLKE